MAEDKNPFSIISDFLQRPNKGLYFEEEDVDLDSVLLDDLLKKSEQQWGIEPDSLLKYMDIIAYHESKSDPNAIQKSDKTKSGHGPGMGLFQYEIERPGQYDEEGKEYINQGAHTAINRLIRITGKDAPEWATELSEMDYDFTMLSPIQQKISFIADMLEKPGASFKGVDTPREVAEVWAKSHQAGTKEGSPERETIIQKFLKDVQSKYPKFK